MGTVEDISPDEVLKAGLIVAGGPTHARGMARSDARQSLAKDDSYRKYGSVEPGLESLRDWLDRLPSGQATAAVFDTLYDKPQWITGSAGKEIGRRLRAKGYSVVGAQSFFVKAVGGPLVEGERERAVAWGRELAATAATPDTHRTAPHSLQKGNRP